MVFTAPPRTGTGSTSGPVPPSTAGCSGELPAVHGAVICVALPGLAVSPEHSDSDRAGPRRLLPPGRRLLSRCQLRVAGRDPIAVQGRSISADRARFLAVVRTAADGGPDPEIAVERLRQADGTERITLSSSAARPLRLPVEIALGTDLAELGAVAAGRAGPELPASVHDSGMRWTSGGAHSAVTAQPPPTDALASAGVLRWALELPPGCLCTIQLTIRTGRPVRPPGHAASPLPSAQEARAEGDDPRVAVLLQHSIDDLRALLIRDPARPADLYAAAGVPWRCGSAPAEALWGGPDGAAAVHPARGGHPPHPRQDSTPGAWEGELGRIPGPFRDAGPYLPPGCSGVEATLAFPVVLAEARRWGLPEPAVTELLPAAERCLHWLATALDDNGYLAKTGPGAAGFVRAETQAHVHRAALLGAELLRECGRPGADAWLARAGALRDRFRARVLAGRPRRRPPRCRPHRRRPPGAAARGGRRPPAGHRAARRRPARARVARHGGDRRWPGCLAGPRWIRGGGCGGSPSRSPGTTRWAPGRAVRVHESAVAVAGLAAAGYEKEAVALLRGVLAAAEAFGHRLPEMYAGEQRTAESVPVPHPAACRPAAVAAAAGIQLLTTLAGIRRTPRPDRSRCTR